MMFDPKTTRIAAAKKLGFDEHFYGLGEKAARLDKRRGHFTMWNSDTFAYEEGTDPIYQSIPFLSDGRMVKHMESFSITVTAHSLILDSQARNMLPVRLKAVK